MTKENEYTELEHAFRGLWDFVTTELHWEYFRAEMLEDETKSGATMENARKLKAFLDELREVHVVDECLKKARG